MSPAPAAASTTTVVGIDLSDLDADGEPNAMAQVVLDLCCSAARVAQSPTDLVGAIASLRSLQRTVAAGAPALSIEPLPELAALIEHVLQLLDAATSITAREE